jgi:hypothetical protein
LSCPNRSAADLTTAGEAARGADERSGPGRYLPSWRRRSSAPASSSHGCLVSGLGLRDGGSSSEPGRGERGFRPRRTGERCVGRGRGLGSRKIAESFSGAVAEEVEEVEEEEEERRRAAWSAMGLGFFHTSLARSPWW